MANCLACIVGMHHECDYPEQVDEVEDKAEECCCTNEVAEEVSTSKGTVITTVLGGYKEDEAVTDPTSTGRKRAAKMKPIIEGMECEWSGLKYAGGGHQSIVGCVGNRLTTVKGNSELTGNIHHGPDKSTLNNTDENLHRVCGKCHNRWHSLNDPHYPQARPANGAPFLPLSGDCAPHDKHTLADAEIMTRSELWWAMDKKTRPEFDDYVYGSSNGNRVA